MSERKKKSSVKVPSGKTETANRRAYPSRSERIAMAEKRIAQLEKLNASLRDLIARSEAQLNERKAALARTEELLKREYALKEHLLDLETDPKGLKKRRELSELSAMLKASGKTAKEVLQALRDE